MALEDLTGSKTIDAMVRTNPTDGDPKSQGDDHFRGMKNVILNTFPNVTGVVTATHTALNQAASRPAFHVHLNNVNSPSQNDGVITKLNLDTESFDTASIYDNITNFRATIAEAGIYLIGFSAQPIDLIDDSVLVNMIYKNAAEIRRATAVHGGSTPLRRMTALVMALEQLAVNDTIEFYTQILNGIATSINGSTTTTFAFAVKVA